MNLRLWTLVQLLTGCLLLRELLGPVPGLVMFLAVVFTIAAVRILRDDPMRGVTVDAE